MKPRNKAFINNTRGAPAMKKRMGERTVNGEENPTHEKVLNQAEWESLSCKSVKTQPSDSKAKASCF